MDLRMTVHRAGGAASLSHVPDPLITLPTRTAGMGNKKPSKPPDSRAGIRQRTRQ
jgi:hypothetical protein